jgi:hypothetical protein
VCIVPKVCTANMKVTCDRQQRPNGRSRRKAGADVVSLQYTTAATDWAQCIAHDVACSIKMLKHATVFDSNALQAQGQVYRPGIAATALVNPRNSPVDVVPCSSAVHAPQWQKCHMFARLDASIHACAALRCAGLRHAKDPDASCPFVATGQRIFAVASPAAAAARNEHCYLCECLSQQACPLHTTRSHSVHYQVVMHAVLASAVASSTYSTGLLKVS